ncbi:MAG TPA: hypothetical protein VIE12_01820 [Actinomycetota bacterium]
MTVERRKTKGIRRVERWFVGVIMAVVAFVLEKAVMRSVRRERGTSAPADPPPTTIRSKGAEADLD